MGIALLAARLVAGWEGTTMPQFVVQSNRLSSIRVLILTCCALVMSMSSAQAAGFWLLDQGASNFGRSGANIASPGDPTAVYLNPAGLAELRGFQLMLGSNMIADSRSFLRAPEPESSEVDYTHYTAGREYERVDNEASMVPSPNIFSAYNFDSMGLPELTMGFGVWGPPRADLQLDEEGPQRYSSINSYNVQAHYGLAAAYAIPWQKLRLGLTVMGITQKVDTKLKLNVPLVAGNVVEDPDKDIGVIINTNQHGILSAVAGLSVEIVDGLVFGASYQFPFKVAGEGVAELEPGK
ncbi:MAG: outer membrane protein transport protein, partial [Myxococcota bacterium]|nr:outer membrane protein transport protein [Myxococcota bacterium]